MNHRTSSNENLKTWTHLAAVVRHLYGHPYFNIALFRSETKYSMVSFFFKFFFRVAFDLHEVSAGFFFKVQVVKFEFGFMYKCNCNMLCKEYTYRK